MDWSTVSQYLSWCTAAGPSGHFEVVKRDGRIAVCRLGNLKISEGVGSFPTPDVGAEVRRAVHLAQTLCTGPFDCVIFEIGRGVIDRIIHFVPRKRPTNGWPEPANPR